MRIKANEETVKTFKNLFEKILKTLLTKSIF